MCLYICRTHFCQESLTNFSLDVSFRIYYTLIVVNSKESTITITIRGNLHLYNCTGCLLYILVSYIKCILIAISACATSQCWFGISISERRSYIIVSIFAPIGSVTLTSSNWRNTCKTVRIIVIVYMGCSCKICSIRLITIPSIIILASQIRRGIYISQSPTLQRICKSFCCTATYTNCICRSTCSISQSYLSSQTLNINISSRMRSCL